MDIRNSISLIESIQRSYAGVFEDDAQEPIVIKLGAGMKHDPESPAQKFIDKYMEVTHPHPMMRGSRLYGYTTSDIRRDLDSPNDTVYISDIMTLEAKNGHANILLKALCGLADKLGVTLTLSAKAYGTDKNFMKMKDLVAWYQRNGFVLDGRGSKENGYPMKRLPH
jgi:hypothetical protein